MDLLKSFTSKKTSEAGTWQDDHDSSNCPLCGVVFNLIVRKHHCRRCGTLCCNDCSQNRAFLDSSRSGAPKRICDKCFAKGEWRRRGEGGGGGQLCLAVRLGSLRLLCLLGLHL